MTDATSWQEMFMITLGHMLESMKIDQRPLWLCTEDTILKGLLQPKDGHLCIKRIMTPMVEASTLKCMRSKQSKTHFSPSKVARSPNNYSKNWKIKGKKYQAFYFLLPYKVLNQVSDRRISANKHRIIGSNQFATPNDIKHFAC